MSDLERIMQEHADRAIGAVRSLMEPPLGLGDYEPFDLSDDDLVWGSVGEGIGPVLGPGVPVVRWPTEQDAAKAHPGGRFGTERLGESIAYARAHGAPSVQLVDGNLNVLKEWPV